MKFTKKLFSFTTVLVGCASYVFGQSLEQPWTMDQCVQTALKNSIAIHNTRDDLIAAQQGIIQARSSLLPRLTANMGHNWITRGPSGATYFDPETQREIRDREEHFTSVSAGASLYQSIYSGGRNTGYLAQSKAIGRMTETYLTDVEQSAILDVKQKYLEYLKSQNLLNVAKEAFRRTEEHLRKTENMYQIGTVAKADVLKSKVQLANGRLSLIDAQNNVDLARSSLCYALGIDVNTPLEIEKTEADTSSALPDFETCVKLALSHRPDIGRLRWNVESKRAAHKVSKANHFPKLSAHASYSWGDEAFGDMEDMFDKKYSWNYGLSLSIPLFEGFSTSAGVKAARKEIQSAERSLEQKQQELTLEIKQILLQFKHAKERIAVTEEGIASAQEDLRLAEERYRLGRATVLEVIDAQVGLTEAKNTQAEAFHEYQLAKLSLEKAMGTLSAR